MLESVCHRFLNAASVRTRAEETEALRAVSMMLKAFRNKDQRDIDETTETSRREISAAIYVLPRDFCRRQHYAWFPARLALSDSHSLRCCGDAGPRISGFHLPGFKWSTSSRKAALSLSIHRAQGPDGYVRRRLSLTSGRDEAQITQSRRCKALLSASGPGLFIMC